MTPPYKFIDEATGETVWSGMDAPAGDFIEVWAGATESSPLHRISPGALERPEDAGPVDPPPIDPIDPPPIDPPPIDPPTLPPIDPPGTGIPMDYPKNESELRQCFETYAANTYVGMLDPRTNVEISSPIVISASTGRPWGVNGNFAQITYRGSGDDVLRIEGVANVNNRGLTIRNLVLDGGDGGNMSGGGASACLRVTAPLGDVGPIYKFHLENIWASGAVNGIILEGGVYEGTCMNMHIENCTGDGMILRHLPQTPEGKAPVVSNVLMWHVNSSRNYGCGLRTVYSVYLVGGSFILNGGGGVVAQDGIRGAIMCNGENTGGPAQAVFDVPSNGYGSYIEMGEASSDGATVCRRWDGSQWHDVGKPLLYFIAMGGGVHESNNHVSYYGSGSNPMKVVA